MTGPVMQLKEIFAGVISLFCNINTGEIMNIYIWVTPFITILIVFKQNYYYKTVMMENTSAEFSQNNFTSVMMMLSIYLSFSMLMAYCVHADGNAGSSYYYTNLYDMKAWTQSSVMLEFFSITLKGISLVFIITTNVVFVISFVACKNLGFDRGYCIDNSSSSKYNLNNKNEGLVQYNKNPDFYFIALLLKLHVVMHFLFLTENLLVLLILFEWSAHMLITIIKNFSKNMADEESAEKLRDTSYLWFYFSVLPVAISLYLFYIKVGTFYIPTMMNSNWSPSSEPYLMFIGQFGFVGKFDFFFGFKMYCILVPCFLSLFVGPSYSWLLITYTYATTEASMVVAGVGMTTGFYVLLTFFLPMFFKSFLVSLMKYMHLYVLVLFPTYIWAMWSEGVQNPHKYKKSLACWSSMKLSLAVGCMFCPAEIGINGVMLFAMGHAISSTGLIYLVGLFYDSKDTSVSSFEFHFQYSGFSGPMIFYFIVFFTIMMNMGCLGSTLYVAHSLMMSGFTAKNDDMAVAFTWLFTNLVSYVMLFFFFQIAGFGGGVSKKEHSDNRYYPPYSWAPFFEDNPKKKYVFLETKKKENNTGLPQDWFIIYFIIFISFFTGFFSEIIMDFLKSQTTTIYSHHTMAWKYSDFFEDKKAVYHWWTTPFFNEEDWSKIIERCTQLKKDPKEFMMEIYCEISWMLRDWWNQ